MVNYIDNKQYLYDQKQGDPFSILSIELDKNKSEALIYAFTTPGDKYKLIKTKVKKKN